MECKLYEYQMIREEIMNSINAIEKIRNLMFTIMVASASFIVQYTNMPLIMLNLLPYIIVLPLLRVSENHLNDIYFLSAYLMVYIEDDAYMPKWETRLYQYRHKPFCIGRNPSLKEKYFTINQEPYYLAAMLCFVLGVIKDNFSGFSICLEILCIMIFSSIYFIIVKDHHKNYEVYIHEWSELRRKNQY